MALGLGVRTKMWAALTIGFLAIIVTSSVAQTSRLNPTADLALTNGVIHTMDGAGTVAEAIGIEDGEIVYIGDAPGFTNVIGIGTEVADLQGNMVLPGYFERHIHPTAGALTIRGVDVQTDNPDAILKRARAYAGENSDQPVIHGDGVRAHIWPDGFPTAAMLDEIDAERPVYLWAVHGHAA